MLNKYKNKKDDNEDLFLLDEELPEYKPMPELTEPKSTRKRRASSVFFAPIDIFPPTMSLPPPVVRIHCSSTSRNLSGRSLRDERRTEQPGETQRQLTQEDINKVLSVLKLADEPDTESFSLSC